MMRIQELEGLSNNEKEFHNQFTLQRKEALREMIDDIGVSELLREIAMITKEDNGLENVILLDALTDGDYELLKAVNEIEHCAAILDADYGL